MNNVEKEAQERAAKQDRFTAAFQKVLENVWGGGVVVDPTNFINVDASKEDQEKAAAYVAWAASRKRRNAGIESWEKLRRESGYGQKHKKETPGVPPPLSLGS